ncbi:hypothetical protein SAMD00019534_064830 [Acytostelium subglobosum LB1]|uniref:hypothetical protein n=1 Tax=Acytostelium subglobosum LB1 TaxID=1410327 RepID=UPI0006450C2C|nr:hypothetical protein SAMD00019534_064830 [Acytostelium subglobosum LB1]GAM23308.1 hypothetical protein SAMD00019534_064830 [Acytostelium subglobosum LB1]|eukprot:XP_012753757.1 hypothetical protein SAMD00019534_064830 [Acytostelium subglobosum LB1]
MDNQSSPTITLESIGLTDWIIKNLNEQGITELLPVQSEIVPFIARTEGHDICVCAPTGSGKTLAYVLPIVQKLHKRIVRRLRVVCIVPTHDLVTQTEATFKAMTKGTTLVVESLGQRAFNLEQGLLVSTHYNDENDDVHYESLVDILVTTPGRLVEHLNETPGFDLQHLTYLVIDEADRLLRDSFQFWLEKVMESTKALKPRSISVSSSGDIRIQDSKYGTHGSHLDHLSFKEARVIKLLLSATMSYNPEKISMLELNAPLYFQSNKISDLKYTIPESLKEHYVTCFADQKPLVLLKLIALAFKAKEEQSSEQQSITASTDTSAADNDSHPRIICFTNSKDTAQRLNTLLGLIGQVEGYKLKTAEYSSSINSIERSTLLKCFKNGEINILICSDILARGMDVPNVDTVINYNSPPSSVLYVHRVGRTARAGREGSAYTILEQEERSFFLGMMKKTGRSQKLNNLKWKRDDYTKYVKRFKQALNQTRVIYTKRKATEQLMKSINSGATVGSMQDSNTIVQDLFEINKKRATMNFDN